MSESFYRAVPKTFKRNLVFRRELIEAGSKSRAVAEEIWIMCKRDLLFYVNTFGWTYDPRLPSGMKKVPFITYPFQDDGLLQMEACLNKEDVFIDKSRDMGATWLLLSLFEHRWHFYDMETFLLMSRKEGLVDDRNDPDSLFWKIDFILENQPKWLLPDFSRNKLQLKNKDNGSTIDGESTTGQSGRASRRTAIGLDEFAMVEDGYSVLASTSGSTNCRFFNSTPKGTGNAFYDRSQNTQKKLRLHWTMHPVKAKGLYYDAQMMPRSPWYDREVARIANSVEVAQELDIDYGASQYRFFMLESIQAHKKNHVRPPYVTGELLHDERTGAPKSFVASDGGKFKLWFKPDENGQAPTTRTYGIGCDISTGSGASNSTLSAGDMLTKEKVLEVATSDMDENEFAALAVATAKWLKGLDFEGARMIWEANGPGSTFGRSVVKLGYRNIYFKQNEKELNPKDTMIPGWFSTRETKRAGMLNYRTCLNMDYFINRSAIALDETLEYLSDADGVYHVKERDCLDPTGARDNHGDRVVADMLLCKLMGAGEIVENKPEIEIPVGSYAYRTKLVQEKKDAQEKDFW